MIARVRERGAFEYVDWVVAHKRLLEALWDSAMEAIEDGGGRGNPGWERR